MDTCVECGRDTTVEMLIEGICPECSTTKAGGRLGGGRTLKDIESPVIEGFEFIKLLGSGSQGRVWQAIQLSENRKVAIKILRRDSGLTEHGRARFAQERRTLGLLDHENVVKVLAHGETGQGDLWYSMEYVVGRPLNEYVNRLDEAHRASGDNEEYPIRPVLELFVRICAGVQAAHAVGVIHRDLKPSNILVDEDGNPHVVDFGIARMPESDVPEVVTLTGQFLGSPLWASPEQVEGQPGRIDVRSDVYSLGIVLYQLLTGTFPYDVQGRSMAEIFDAIRQYEPVSPREHSLWIDDELNAILLKAIAKEKPRRYQTAEEFRDDLQSYLDGDPVQARGDSSAYLLRKFARRNRVLVSVASSVTIMSLIAGVILTRFYVDAVDAFEQAQIAQRDEAAARLSEKRAHALNALRLGEPETCLRAIKEIDESTIAEDLELQLAKVEALDIQGRSDEALKIVDDLIRAEPAEWAAEISLWWGDLSLTNPDRQESGIQRIEEAIELGLDAPDEAYARGLIAERTSEAITHLSRSVKLDPGHDRARQMLGVVYLFAERREDARRTFELALIRSPKNPMILLFLAVIDTVEGDEASMQKYIERMRDKISDTQLIAIREILGVVLDAQKQSLEGFRENAVTILSAYSMRLAPAVLSLRQLDETDINPIDGIVRRLPPAIQSSWISILSVWLKTVTTNSNIGFLDLEDTLVEADGGTPLVFLSLGFIEARREQDAVEALDRSLESTFLIPSYRKWALLMFLTYETGLVVSDLIPREQMAERENRYLRRVFEYRQTVQDKEWMHIWGIASGLSKFGHSDFGKDLMRDFWHLAPEGDVRGPMIMASISYQAGDYQDAIKYAKIWLERQPGNPGPKKIIRESEEALRVLVAGLESQGLAEYPATDSGS